MNTFFEQSGGTYSAVDDYQFPNLSLPSEPEPHISIWGKRRFDYLKHHRRVIYANLLTSGKLYKHLCEIDATALERKEIVIPKMATARGVTERLKTDN